MNYCGHAFVNKMAANRKRSAPASTSSLSKPPLTIKIDLKRIKEQNDGAGSVDSFDSDEELSVGEEGSLKIDWEEENSRDVPQGGVDEIGEEEVEVDVETADVERGNGSSEEEEEEWLNALEKGTVDETGYLPGQATKNLTTRQKALMEGSEGPLLALPMFSKKKAETEEMLLKKSERNRRRKIRANQRREQVKAETIQKLLQKQSAKRKDEEKVEVAKTEGPTVRYVDGPNGISVSFPEGFAFPLAAQKGPPECPKAGLCCVKGCKNRKKYSDSQLKLPLCSLECYKKLKCCSKVSEDIGFTQNVTK